jgi:hypothetical protein
LIQDEPVGVKRRWKRGVAVHIQVGGDGLVDGDQELAKLDRAVLAVQFGDDAAVRR